MSGLMPTLRAGLPMLFESARQQDAEQPGAGAVAELERRIARETRWLNVQVWPGAAP